VSYHDAGPTPGELVVKRVVHEKGKNSRAQLDHAFEVEAAHPYAKGACRIGGDGPESPHFVVARIPWSPHAEADAHLFAASPRLLSALKTARLHLESFVAADSDPLNDVVREIDAALARATQTDGTEGRGR
jgi:hypothetical protein